jgi:hypothetical protein
MAELITRRRAENAAARRVRLGLPCTSTDAQCADAEAAVLARSEPPPPPTTIEYVEPSRQPYAEAFAAASAAGLGGLAAEAEPGSSAKVLVLQRAGLSPAFVESALVAAAADGRPVDFAVLPENSGPSGCNGRVELENNPPLQAFADVAQRQCCYLVLGTMMEFDRPTKLTYCTCVVIGPEGMVVCRYRKRHHPGGSLKITAGDAPGFFETRWGRVAVMICYDAEHDGYVAETLALEPTLVLNPIQVRRAECRSASGERRGGEDQIAEVRLDVERERERARERAGRGERREEEMSIAHRVCTGI